MEGHFDGIGTEFRSRRILRTPVSIGACRSVSNWSRKVDGIAVGDGIRRMRMETVSLGERAIAGEANAIGEGGAQRREQI